MIYILPGSHAINITTILSVAGEFSLTSSRLLGNESLMYRTIRNMSKPQDILMGDMKYSGQLISVTGKGSMRSVRLRKWAYPILREIKAEEYYKTTFTPKSFTGCKRHKDRNFRVAECLIMFFRAGIEFRPYALPRLQCDEIKMVVPNLPCFYLSKELKKLKFEELLKTQFTRAIGLLFIRRKPYAVYNTRSSLMKWCGEGERKIISNFQAITRLNAEREDVDAAIVFYENEETAINTVRDISKNEKLKHGFINLYRKIHLIPLGENGIRQLQLFMKRDWWKKVITNMFQDNALQIGYFNHDAEIDEREIFCFFDGDVARLIRFKNSVRTNNSEFEVVCFPHQVKIIEEYFGFDIPMRVVSIEQVEKIISKEVK